MIFRLIELVLPKSNREDVEKLLEEYNVMDYSISTYSETNLEFHIIVGRDLQKNCLEFSRKGFQIWMDSG